MNIASWKETAELIALVAVVGSLIAVVFELRQTQGALQAQAYQARAFDGIEMNKQLALDPELDRLTQFIESPDFDPSQLSAADYRKTVYLLTITRIDLDNEHYQYQKGFLDPGFYHGETVLWIRDAAPKWRAMGMGEPRPDFREEVDRILSELPGTPPQ